MKRIRRTVGIRTAAALSAVATVLLATGCVVQGNPVAGYPDPTSLDVGKYSIRPLDEPSGNETYGRVVEASRLAEALIDPVEVDAALNFSASPSGVLLLPTPAKATLLLAEPIRAVLEQNGMLTGAAVGGADVRPSVEGPQVGADRVLSVIVLRFPDEAAAQRAAADIDTADAAVNAGNVSVEIPEYPAAHAHWRPTVPTLAATVADGAYVVSMLIGELTTDLDALTGLARKALDAQLPRLRAFDSTPRDQLATLPLDREGMLRRMVPAAPGRWPYPVVTLGSSERVAAWTALANGAGVVYGPRAAVAWNRSATPDSGIELQAVNGWTTLARFSSAQAARRFFGEVMVRQSPKYDYRAVAGPAGVPDVFCNEDVNPEAMEELKFGCTVLHGRYLGSQVGRDLNALHQRARAQYGLLVTAG